MSMGSNCRSSSGQWLFVNGICTAIHIAAAFYIVKRIQSDGLTSNPDGQVLPSTTTTSSSTKDVALRQAETGMADPVKQNGTPTTQYHRVVETTTSSGTIGRSSFYMFSSTTTSIGGANTVPRLIQVLCYDVLVAIYILIFLGWMVWQTLGLSHAMGDGSGDNCGNHSDLIHKWIVNSIILGFIYMMMLCCSFCCSLLCLRPI